MAGGLEGQENVSPTFIAAAGNKAPTFRDFALAPPDQWADMTKNGSVPPNLDSLQLNLTRQADQLVKMAEFRIANEVAYMHRGEVQGKPYEPKDPTKSGNTNDLLDGNPLVKQMFDDAIAKAKEDPAFGKEADPKFGNAMVHEMAGELKDVYHAKVDGLMRGYREPEAAPAPQPAPEQAPASPPGIVVQDRGFNV